MRCSTLLFIFLMITSLAAAQTVDAPPLSKEGEEAPALVRHFDGFDNGPALNWDIRNPDQEHYSYHKRLGTLTITTQKGGIHGTSDNCKNLFLLANPVPKGKDFEITTCLVDFRPEKRWHQAGLVCYDDQDNYMKFVCEFSLGDGKRKLELLREDRGAVAAPDYFYSVPQVSRLWLRLTKRGNHYAYSSSSDGKTFRAHGDVPWGSGAPAWVGLVAKNGNSGTTSGLDASFDFFELRERLAGEPPVYRYVMPSDDVDELLNFIVRLREFAPSSHEEAKLHEERSPELLRSAAKKIVEQEKEKESDAFQMALLVLLEDRVRDLPEATVEWQEQTVKLAKDYLTAKRSELGKELDTQDVALALKIGDALERAGRLARAAEVYEMYAKIIREEGSEKHAQSLAVLAGGARRLRLAGREFLRDAGPEIHAAFDWESYRGKAIALAFFTRAPGASLDEIREIERMHRLYRDRGFQVLPICIDGSVPARIQRLGADGSSSRKTSEAYQSECHPLAVHLGVTSAPAVVMIDKTGKVVSARMQLDELGRWLEDSLGPAYAPTGELSFLDLASRANQKLTEKLHNIENNDLSELPQGEHVFAGVRFRIEDALVQLSGRDLKGRPDTITGIPVGTTFAKLYFLHGAGGKIGDGTIIGRYRVNYASGATETIPIVYGEDVRNWLADWDPRPAARGTIAWTGSNPYLRRHHGTARLYLGVWKNPRPSARVVSIECISAKTLASPFCVAMTVEGGGMRDDRD